MLTRQVFSALGVSASTLADEERRRLDDDGFVLLEDVLTPAQCDEIAARVDELIVAEGDAAGVEVHQESGTERLSDLCNKGACFDLAWQHPRLLAAVAHVLDGDLRLSSLNYRSPMPGFGNQGLHADWGTPTPDGCFQVCNSMWCIDALTAENGATRLVPGSHRSAETPQASMTDRFGRHPGEIVLEAPRGAVVVVNAHTWHGGTVNRTGAKRRVLHSYWSRRSQPQQLDQRAWIRPETYDRLSPAARWLLDVDGTREGTLAAIDRAGMQRVVLEGRRLVRRSAAGDVLQVLTHENG